MSDRFRKSASAFSALALYLVADPVLAANAHEANSEEAVRRFVQAFYNWYSPFFDKGGDADKALDIRPGLFDGRLASALKEDRAVQSDHKSVLQSLAVLKKDRAKHPC